MTVYKYGKEEASVILIQPVGDHDINLMEEEAVAIKRLTKMDFGLFAVKVDNWNADLSPWQNGNITSADILLQDFLPCGHRIRLECLREPLQLLRPCGSRDFFLI